MVGSFRWFVGFACVLSGFISAGCADSCEDDGLAQSESGCGIVESGSEAASSSASTDTSSSSTTSTAPASSSDGGFESTGPDDDVAVCGNERIEVGESCDAGPEGSSTCDADCTPAVCGDGLVNAIAGETCDENGATANCDYDCSVPECGDGIINAAAGEQCEPTDDRSSCSDQCRLVGDAAACGNGVLDPGETCDEGGVATVDCDPDCTAPECGDGVTNPFAGETCDGAGDNLLCDADCTPTQCGDGYVNPVAEGCDHGGAGQTADCEADCSVSQCGDGVLNALAGEACDDTNTEAGDGCDETCQGECQNGATLETVAPNGLAAMCRDETDSTCQGDLETLCPASWHLCTYEEFNARNDGWDHPVGPSNYGLGAAYCRGGSGAGHFAAGAYQGVSNLGEETVLLSCGISGSLPACPSSFGCNVFFAGALCCAPNPTCGNGVVDSIEEACDDGNADDTDDCLSTCTWRVPTDHGLDGPGC